MYLTFLKWAGIIVVVVALITALVAAISVLTGKGDEMSRTMDSLGGSVGNMTGSLQGGNGYRPDRYSCPSPEPPAPPG